jgi:hypothetical protein
VRLFAWDNSVSMCSGRFSCNGILKRFPPNLQNLTCHIDKHCGGRPSMTGLSCLPCNTCTSHHHTSSCLKPLRTVRWLSKKSCGFLNWAAHPSLSWKYYAAITKKGCHVRTYTNSFECNSEELECSISVAWDVTEILNRFRMGEVCPPMSMQRNILRSQAVDFIHDKLDSWWGILFAGRF